MRGYFLAPLFPRELVFLKKKSETDSRNMVPVSYVIGLKVWEMRNKQAEDREN